MRVPSLSITYSIICCAFVSASTFSNRTTTEFSASGTMSSLDDHPDSSGSDDRAPSNSSVREDASSSSWDAATLVSTVCKLSPNTCQKIKGVFVDTGEFEARGPKDLIAIISTMLAGLLGAILVKLNVLIVLSLISVGIGKLLLLLLVLKTKIFSTDHSYQQHQQHQPIVYEKVYYPRRHYANIPDHQQEYASEMVQEYSPPVYSR